MTAPAQPRWRSPRLAISGFRRAAAVVMLLGAGTFLAVWGNPYLLAHLVYLTAVLLIVPFIIVFPTAVPGALSAFPTLVLPAAAQLAVPIAFGFLAWVLWPQEPLFGTWSRRALIRLRGVCVALAVVVPVGFAVIRLAWAVGIPLGIDESFREANPGSSAQQQVGTWIAEVFWPIWGIALIVAVLVYAELRRRDEPQTTCNPGP